MLEADLKDKWPLGGDETPRPASSVILVRDDTGGDLEVYMTCRQERLAVLGGYYVFPGGTLDEADSSRDIFERCMGLEPTEAADIFGDGLDPAVAMGHWVAAVRELFEEAGVFLACRPGDEIVDFGQESLRERFYSYRHELQRGNLGFLELLGREKLTLATNRLYYFKHLVTPPGPWRRFDARFFVATVPGAQRPRYHEAEVSEVCWVQPSEALQRAERDEWKMIVPTKLVLATLAEYNSAEELLRSVKGFEGPINYEF